MQGAKLCQGRTSAADTCQLAQSAYHSLTEQVCFDAYKEETGARRHSSSLYKSSIQGHEQQHSSMSALVRHMSLHPLKSGSLSSIQKIPCLYHSALYNDPPSNQTCLYPPYMIQLSQSLSQL